MNQSGRHVRTSELLPPPNMGMALGLGAAAAVAGAAAWAALIVAANAEVGYLAWGIGALVGFAVVKGGGHGQMLAVCAAVLSVLSIGAGRHFHYQQVIEEAVDDQMEHVTADMHAKYLQRGRDWAALGPAPTDEQITEFALDNGYEVRDVAEFRNNHAPDLDERAKNPLGLEEWRDRARSYLAAGYSEELTFIDYLKKTLKPVSIIFVLLGVGSAFSLVMRHTTTMQVAARQQLRAEREAEEAAAAPTEERAN